MKRRLKFTLGSGPAVSPKPSKVRLAPPKRESPKIQAHAAAPPPLSLPAVDAVKKDDEPIPVKLPRAQLELEYVVVVQKRELLLNQLAGVLEEFMVSVPAD
jgi:hypothetical protein